MIRTPPLILILLLLTPASAAPPTPTATEEAAVLREANRVLEEELKTAARPQLYLILDLAEGAMLVKGRGLELHRLPIIQWQLSTEVGLEQTFRLQVRPPVNRPKLAPGEDPAEIVIDLDDMPAEYQLFFEPNLVVSVAPPASQQPLLWARSRLREWRARFTAPAAPAAPRLRLTLAEQDVRSLAWMVLDGMPLIVKRPVAPQP